MQGLIEQIGVEQRRKVRRQGVARAWRCGGEPLSLLDGSEPDEPLSQRLIAALAHSAMGLDIYTWLAQRLHRVRRGRQELVPWAVLHEQFGASYTRLRDFRGFFLRQLAAVHIQYPDARFEANRKGLWIRHSPPPVTRSAVTIDATTVSSPRCLRTSAVRLNIESVRFV